MLENNDRLTKAINEMPEWERAVKEAVKVEEVRIRALESGLREACDNWEQLDSNQQVASRIAALRDLAGKAKP